MWIIQDTVNNSENYDRWFALRINSENFNNKIINYWNLNKDNFYKLIDDIKLWNKIMEDNAIKFIDFKNEKTSIFKMDSKLTSYLIKNKIDIDFLDVALNSLKLYELLLCIFCNDLNCEKLKINLNMESKIFKNDDFQWIIDEFNKKEKYDKENIQKNNHIIKLSEDLDLIKWNIYQLNIYNSFKNTTILNKQEISLTFCEKHFNEYIQKANLNKENLLQKILLFGFNDFQKNYAWDLEKKLLNFKTLRSKIEFYLHKNGIELDKFGSESIWFRDNNYFHSIPYKWEFYEVKKIIYGSEQGNLNGPDFIFKDTQHNKTIGFEVFFLNSNIIKPNYKILNEKKFFETIKKQYTPKLYLNYDDKKKLAVNMINTKIEKWKKFINTSEKIIGILINGEDTNSLDYFRLEIELNDLYNSKGFNIIIL